MSETLYRKYRPQNFDEVVGQDHVVITLQNAVKNNEISHAYVFSGPRGTGKTSVARILAKEMGVTGIDLIEIDAASHRGIDQMREIKETVNFRPAQSPSKMYILDEAHMLTNEAFNALLKTIEEPPSYVYFVLCTTEPHKIPLTIISRCQRFAFNLASDEDLFQYLENTASSEALNITKDALELIVKLAKGSYRDALVFLGQATSLSDEAKIDSIALRKGLGLPSGEEVDGLIKYIIQKDGIRFFEGLQALQSNAVSMVQVLDMLIDHLVDRLQLGEHKEDETMGIVEVLDLLLQIRARMKYVDNPKSVVTVEILKYFTKPKNIDDPQTNGSKGKDFKNIDEPEYNNKIEEEPQKKVRVNATLAQNAKISNANVSDVMDWSAVMKRAKDKKRTVEALLKGGTPKGFNDKGQFTIHFSYKFHKEKIEQNDNRQVIEEVLSEIHGSPVTIYCVLEEGANGSATWNDVTLVEATMTEKTEDQAKSSKQKNSYKNKKEDDFGGDELLKLAQDVFGGQMIE